MVKNPPAKKKHKRIHLPMQGTQVQALVQEDPTCRGATKPMHNYWACEPQLLSPRATTTEACAPRACVPQQEKPPQRKPVCCNYWAHTPQLRKTTSSRARVPQLLSPRTATTEALVPRACALPTREATAMRSPRTTMKSSPHLPQLEKAHTQQQRPNAAKLKKKKAIRSSREWV